MHKGFWIAVAIIVIGLYFVYSSSSSSELNKIQAEQFYIDQRIENNRSNLTSCLDDVDLRIKDDLMKWCKSFADAKNQFPNDKFIDMGNNCAFPLSVLEDFTKGWEKQKKEGREECYKLYSQ